MSERSYHSMFRMLHNRSPLHIVGGVTGTTYWHSLSSCLLGAWVDVLVFRTTLPVLTVHESSMLTSSSTASIDWTNRQCSPPAAQHLSNAMASNEPSPLLYWNRLGHNKETWNRLSEMAIEIIRHSMPRRLKECLTNRGGITHYYYY